MWPVGVIGEKVGAYSFTSTAVCSDVSNAE